MKRENIELTRTHLVQRLEAPISYENPCAFGGGYINGGLSKEARSYLKGIFSVAYMGAAEYEFGAFGQFFNALVKRREDYGIWEISVNKTPIYVIGDIRLKDTIDERINLIAKEKSGYIKCGCDLSTAVGLNKYSKKEDCRTIGYLELDNTFAFFTRQQTADDFAKLFGIS